MVGVLNATDVRKDFGAFIDKVVRGRPAVVKRNRDFFAAVSLDHLNLMLSPYRFTLEYASEANGSFSGSFKEIDLVANGQTLDELKQVLAQELIEYAQEYMDNFAMYFHSPNRKPHLPYVMRVLIQPSKSDVVKLIDG